MRRIGILTAISWGLLALNMNAADPPLLLPQSNAPVPLPQMTNGLQPIIIHGPVTINQIQPAAPTGQLQTINAPGQVQPVPVPTQTQPAPVSTESQCPNCAAGSQQPKSGFFGKVKKVIHYPFTPEHQCEPDGCPTPIGCSNIWTEFKFVFGSCSQFFGNADATYGNCKKTTVPPPWQTR